MATVLVMTYVVMWSYHTSTLTNPPYRQRQALKMVTSPNGRITSLLKMSEDYVVPNIVHFIWLGEYAPLQFHHLLSIKSAAIFIRPAHIYLHCDHEPIGFWWKAIRNIVKLHVMKVDPPASIFGHRVTRSEHKSDLMRIEVLLEHGGIFLETDVIVLKSFEALRRYDFTMGLEYHSKPGRLNNGIIVAKRNATFLNIWRKTYHNFTEMELDYHSSIIPYHLQYQFPQLIHVEERSLNYPSGPARHLIYDDVYDWTNNYAMHMWFGLHGLNHTPNDIKSMNTTFGQIARYVYYNTTALLK